MNTSSYELIQKFNVPCKRPAVRRCIHSYTYLSVRKRIINCKMLLEATNSTHMLWRMPLIYHHFGRCLRITSLHFGCTHTKLSARGSLSEHIMVQGTLHCLLQYWILVWLIVDPVCFTIRSAISKPIRKFIRPDSFITSLQCKPRTCLLLSCCMQPVPLCTWSLPVAQN